jgi:hypothetical protein
LTFPIAETPLSATPHLFPPSLFNNLLPLSPLLKHHCSTLFDFPLLLKHHCQQSFTMLPIAETPFTTTFLHSPYCQNTTVDNSSHFLIDETTPSNNCFAFSFLLLKHHCQQLFAETILPIAETPCQQHFLLKHVNFPIAKTLHSTILHISLIDETTPSSNCFAFFFLLLKHHCSKFFTFSHCRNNTVQQLFRPVLFCC